MRSLFLGVCLLVCANAACGSTAQTKSEVPQFTYVECVDEEPKGKYGCSPGRPCSILMSDVKELKGYHVVEIVVSATGRTRVHVADYCQHYFCDVDESCMKMSASALWCMVTTGCAIVQPIR